MLENLPETAHFELLAHFKMGWAVFQHCVKLSNTPMNYMSFCYLTKTALRAKGVMCKVVYVLLQRPV